jgi:hypothetical protein
MSLILIQRIFNKSKILFNCRIFFLFRDLKIWIKLVYNLNFELVFERIKITFSYRKVLGFVCEEIISPK